jgi:NAD(P)-dependent dehydrogenase (short-subunit alcohol dehydrogenase family)
MLRFVTVWRCDEYWQRRDRCVLYAALELWTTTAFTCAPQTGPGVVGKSGSTNPDPTMSQPPPAPASEERVAVVTGGSSGLGAAIVEHLAGRGFGVCLNYRSEAKAQRLLEQMPTADAARVLLFPADVADREQVRSMFDAVIERFGRVDVLVNSAGFNRDAPFVEMTDEQFDSVIASHLRGHFVCGQEFVFHNPDREGLILNFAAPCGVQGRLNGANFCSSKGAILALTKCMALELAPRIRVNCLQPASVITPEVVERYNLESAAGREREIAKIPLGRLGDISDVTAMFDAILAARFTTGACFNVSGGQLME